MPAFLRAAPRRAAAAAAVALALVAPAQAEPLHLLADIPPVATLLGAVAGTPVTALLGPGDDPHHFQLRPSQARALASAEVVVWTGSGLTPWLGRVIDSAAAGAVVVELLHAPGMRLLAPHFDHDHAHEHDHGAPPAPGAAASDSPADTPAPDPHLWLDPDNAAAMLAASAAALTAADPAGAADYARNAAAARAELDAQVAQARAVMAPLAGLRLLVSHDGLTYWAAAFDLDIVAALTDAAATDPGAASLGALRRRLAAGEVDCLLVEPQHAAALARALAEEFALPVVEVAPLHSDGVPGDWFTGLAEALAQCRAG